MRPRRSSFSGLLLTLLALAAQLVLGAAMPRATATATLSLVHDATVLCHEDNEPDAPSQPQHDPSDCAFCPLCITLAAQLPPLLSTGSVLPLPGGVVVRRAAPLPAALAPPTVHRLSARPRAPPSLA